MNFNSFIEFYFYYVYLKDTWKTLGNVKWESYNFYNAFEVFWSCLPQISLRSTSLQSLPPCVTPCATPCAGIWLRWRHEAKQNKTALQAQKAVEMEVGAWEPGAGTGIVDWIVHDSTRAQHLKQHHMAYLVSVNPCQPKDKHQSAGQQIWPIAKTWSVLSEFVRFAFRPKSLRSFWKMSAGIRFELGQLGVACLALSLMHFISWWHIVQYRSI